MAFHPVVTGSISAQRSSGKSLVQGLRSLTLPLQHGQIRRPARSSHSHTLRRHRDISSRTALSCGSRSMTAATCGSATSPTRRALIGLSAEGHVSRVSPTDPAVLRPIHGDRRRFCWRRLLCRPLRGPRFRTMVVLLSTRASTSPDFLAAALSGATTGQLRSWRQDRGNGPVLCPELAAKPALYSFRDVLALRAFAILRQDVSLQKIRKALAAEAVRRVRSPVELLPGG